MSNQYRYYTSLSIASLGTTSLAKCSILVVILYTLSLISGSPAFAQAVVDGGLTVPEVGWSLGSNLLVNGDFSQGPPGGPFRVPASSPVPHLLAPTGAPA